MALDNPIMKEKGYIIRGISSDDYLDLYFIASSFDTTKYLTFNQLESTSEALILINRFYINDGNYLPNAFVIENKKHEVIGIIELHSYNSIENSCEIGFLLREDYEGKGVMTIALKNIIDKAFNYYNYSKLYVSFVDKNIKCRNLVLRFPFNYESIKTGAFTDKETKELRDILVYSMYKNDYLMED